MNKYAQFSKSDSPELIGWKRSRTASWLRSCGKKRRYRSEREAEQVVAKVAETNKELGLPPPRYYFCKICACYHITKTKLWDKRKDEPAKEQPCPK